MESKNDMKSTFCTRAEGTAVEKNKLSQAQGIYEFAAHIYDLDGVITSTEKLHFDGWKDTFDKLITSLRESNLLAQGAPEEFNEKHYLDYVDGKPRYDGVSSFIDALGTGDDCLAVKVATQAQDESLVQRKTSGYLQEVDIYWDSDGERSGGGSGDIKSPFIMKTWQTVLIGFQ